MRYLCLDDGAVNELISGREYQSIDFEEGDKLIQALEGKKKFKFLLKIKNVILVQDSEGAFLTTLGPWKKKKFVVIDCDQSELFTQLRSHESLTSFQKLLRFCAKFWSNGVLNQSEKMIPGTSKTVLFPFSISVSGGFRVAIEREPLKERLKKRDLNGHFLLVYKSGDKGADSAEERADEQNFRRVLDRLPEIYDDTSRAEKSIADAPDERQMALTALNSNKSSLRPVHMPVKNWLPLLTNQQRKFVFSGARTPHRLQGPAGTGKTLSLMLKTARLLFEAEKKGKEFHALLVAHSDATRDSIRNALSVIDPDGYQEKLRKENKVTLSVETLASLCAEFLSQSISESEFVDRDAQDSKLLQQMYIEQSISETRKHDFASYKPHLSEAFRKEFETKSNQTLAPLFQHEVSVIIKGRAGDSFDVYKKCPALKYGLPVVNDADKGLVFCVFRRYQSQLESSSQFDTDDVVISAIGQLDTPIWRRRRLREGFDFIAIDETHLFNINELHIFHHFTRKVGDFPISFTVDEAQAVGDRGWSDVSTFFDLFGKDDEDQEEQTSVAAVFRSAPAIVDFSQTVLASGATLFTNFVNTLSNSQSVFSLEDERRSSPVSYIEYADDLAMIEGAFDRAGVLQRETNSLKSEVLLTSLSDELVEKLKVYSEKNNKPVTFLDRRGDYTRLKQAEKSGHAVLGHADFVGGLEFNVVVIVGVDKGRVPQEGSTEDSNSRSHASYAAHNRLYVASTRAKYALNILGIRSRGPSDLLRGAVKQGLIGGVPKQ